MSLRIELDNSNQAVFTCLDFISGRVVLTLPHDDTVSSITVKLEGVSRTRLEPPRIEIPIDRPRDKRRPEVEVHRLLYVVHTVFPAEAIRENPVSSAGFTLKGGQYDYPFKIRIPINSSCTDGMAGSGAIASGLLQRVNFDVSKGTIEYARQSSHHVRGTLPPSLSGVTEDSAWIRYFLKATVNRPQFYKTNIRQHKPIVFLPLEPPRPPPTTAETFARRKHEFITTPQSAAHSPTRRRFLSVLRKGGPTSPTLSIPIRFSVEARLPSPPVIVPGEPLPLRIMLTKLDPFHEVVVMRTLQITLLADTHIIAHELFKDDLTQFLLLSKADLHLPFGDRDAPPNELLEMDPSLWSARTVPDSVPPNFTTCNISRCYQLQVEIGLSLASSVHYDIVSLKLPLEVYSGIRPPQQLVDSAIRPPPLLPPRHTTSSMTVPTLGSPSRKSPLPATTSPIASPAPPALPGRPHSYHNPPIQGQTDDGFGGQLDNVPPPTYEDAIADDIGPVDGPRRRYQQEGGYYQALPDDLHA